MNHLGPAGSKPSGTGLNIGERIAPHHEHAVRSRAELHRAAPAGYELVYTRLRLSSHSGSSLPRPVPGLPESLLGLQEILDVKVESLPDVGERFKVRVAPGVAAF